MSTPEMEVLRQRLIDDALINQGFIPSTGRYIQSEFEKAADYLTTLEANGSWKDVDYADRDNFWNPLVALDRILVMTYAYCKKHDSLYQNEELLGGSVKALQYWYQVAPECKNWYKNEIAKQFYFNVVALLLQDKIDANLLARMTNDLTEEPRMTGSNKTLLSISVFYRGILEKNSNRVQAGIAGVRDQIRIVTDEGVQPDYSFHQHGAFLYNGRLRT